MPTIKVATIGDGNVGKTCLIKRFIKNEYSDENQASTFDDYTKDLVYNDVSYTLEIKDLGG